MPPLDAAEDEGLCENGKTDPATTATHKEDDMAPPQTRFQPHTPRAIVRKRLKKADRYRFPHTMFGPATVFTTMRNGTPIRVLSVGGAYQSATFLGDRRFDLVFPYYQAFDLVFRTDLAATSILAIGGGGCSWPKHVAATQPDVTIDVVEPDPAVIDIARTLFFVDELEQLGRLRLIAADGRAFLDGIDETSHRYDAIVVDAFAGTRPVASLSTLEAARSAKRRLNPNGIYLTNVVSCGSGSDVTFLLDEAATFARVFAHVCVVPCADAGFAEEDNYLLVATDGPWQIDAALSLPHDVGGRIMRDAASITDHATA